MKKFTSAWGLGFYIRNMALFNRRKVDVETEKAAISAFSHEYPPDKLPRQITMYLLVGVIGTGADFAVMNFFLYATHWPLLIANSLGITGGLIVGYFTNKKWVFRRSQRPTTKHKGYFVIITAIGLYGIQNGLMMLMAIYPEAQNVSATFVQSIIGHIPTGELRTNIVKLIASTLAGIFNFFLYRKFVFLYGDRKSTS